MESENLCKFLIKFGIKTKLEPDIIKAIKMVNKAVTNSIPGIIFGSHYIGESIYKEYGFPFDNGII